MVVPLQPGVQGLYLEAAGAGLAQQARRGLCACASLAHIRRQDLQGRVYHYHGQIEELLQLIQV